MLEIDDLKKLAKMMEVLLDRTQDNKEINLEKYKNIVKEIDNDSFEKLLSLLKQFEYHNLTLEEELEFLEKVNCSYQQIIEQQFGFKNVYELYSSDELQLSNLEQINIDYIVNRINNISGYLINKKNIDINQNKLHELNKRLICEEKEKNNLNKRLLEFEEILRNSFISAEGRCIDNGKLQYVSVISEYSLLEIDFKDLLYNEKELKKILSLTSSEKVDTGEKLQIAEICYNNAPSVDSKQVLDDIRIEDLKIRYKLTLLKIIELLSKNCDNYDDFKEKREQLLDLIKYRLTCVNMLGKSISIDPFSRTKVSEQIEILASLKDNSKEINRIKKEIASLDQRLDEMIAKDKEFMVNLNVKDDLILRKMSINDIDISSVVLPDDGDIVEKIAVKNQVVDVKDIPMQFRYSIVRQKVNCVIERVNEMINNPLISEEKVEILSPELIIVPSHDVELEDVSSMDDSRIDEVNLISTNNSEDDVVEDNEVVVFNDEKIFDDDMFKNVDPFLSAPLFTDKTDSDDVVESIFINEEENTKHEVINEDKIDVSKVSIDENQFDEEMPDAFWVTQSDGDDLLVKNNDEFQLSFDEQIDALLSDEEDNSKIRKKK